MVEVIYLGQLGNRLFQYCFARIIAEGLGFCLKADPIPGFPNTETKLDGADYSDTDTDVQLIRYQDINLEVLFRDKPKRKIKIHGYFQKYKYFKTYRDIIRNNWLVTKELVHENEISSNDVVLHVRRGDYVSMGHALPFSYYEEALKKASADRVFICTDDPSDKFVAALCNKYHATIYHNPNEPWKDLKFISSFNKIIQSASSFSWWAAFLSRAEEIYTPIPRTGYWTHPNVSLAVDDEDRYIYIPCQEKTFFDFQFEWKRRLLFEVTNLNL